MELPMRTVVLLMAVLQVLVLERHVQGAAGDAKNGQQYRAMCTLVEIARQKVTNLGKATLDRADVDTIEDLNMSASSLAWQSKFPSKGPTQPAPAPTCTGSKQPIECHADYNKWKSAKIRTAARPPEDPTLKVFNGIQETALGKRTSAAISNIAQDAAALYSTYEKTVKTTLDAAQEAVNYALQDALWGKQTRPLSGEGQDKWTPTGTRGKDCKDSSAGISLRGDITCLCAKDSTQNTDICGPNVDNTASAWSNSVAKQAANRITAKCAELAKPTLTVQTIRAALLNFDAQLRSHTTGSKDAIHICTPKSDGSCESSDDGGCVDYTKAL
uniref:Variant surface glycoprotein 1673 n=1 Tax=Trypanosoma brucei TaxID=5691 RepID=M4SW00_9TRYP|nr:variant surface glycoprotein 1673 [Trypanosoma brucei]